MITNAFLSYRHNNHIGIAARECLKPLCDDAGIRLVYDEVVTQQGDSLITFMEDLTAARCIFLLLSPDYFESSYTLFELLCIAEREDFDASLILPIRLTDQVNTYAKTQAKEFWEANEDKRNELGRLLRNNNQLKNHSEDDHAAIWQRLEAAWEIIFSHLDELHPSIESAETEAVLKYHITKSADNIQSLVNASTKELKCTIHTKVVSILSKHRIPLAAMTEELPLADNVSPKDLTDYLLEHKTVGEIMDLLTGFALKQKKVLATGSEQWQAFLFDLEQLCGWVLLKSVEPKWWFQQSLRMKKSFGNCVVNSFPLDEPAYIEVILSRSLLQGANYKLDDYGDIYPASDGHDIMLFDAVSPGAVDIELLQPIYKDLRNQNNAPTNVPRLLKAIIITAKKLYDAQSEKPVYYLVTSDYLQLLQQQDWFEAIEKGLEGALQFVCCDIRAKPYDQNPCVDSEQQGDLLESLAIILRLRNEKDTSHA